MLSNIRDLFIKFVFIVVVLMLILTLANFVAQYFELRPQSVLSYGLLGYIVTSNTLILYDRFVNGYEEPLPNHVMLELNKCKKELEPIKELINDSDRMIISKDEVEVFAKGKIAEDENNKRRYKEKKEAYTKQVEEKYNNKKRR